MTDYFPGAEKAGEMARLNEQGKRITKVSGGRLAEQPDTASYKNILDVACGPGEWVLDVAFAYPETRVEGFDISRRMIAYAQDRASEQGLENASFQVMDATKIPYDFEDASFDLVNARTIAGAMPAATWPLFVQECRRILRPGGVIRLTECDSWGTTNSPAFEQLQNLTFLAARKAGLSFSVDGKTLALTAMLGKLLQDTGYQNIQEKSFTNNFSGYTEEADRLTNARTYMAFYRLSAPTLAKLNEVSLEEIYHLCDQLDEEMLAEGFVGNCFFLTVWGHTAIDHELHNVYGVPSSLLQRESPH